ncbi:Nucleolar protein 13 [Saitoella coloradoensis]
MAFEKVGSSSKDKKERKVKGEKKVKKVKDVQVDDQPAQAEDVDEKSEKRKKRKDVQVEDQPAQAEDVDEKSEKRKKRKATETEEEELEINLDLAKPPSKKQLRQLKKAGKISEDITDPLEAAAVIAPKKPKAEAQAPKRSDYSVWVGNLSFQTTKALLKDFFITRTRAKETPLLEEDMTRINVPMKSKTENKGFAYVDFETKEQMDLAVSLSEEPLNGRRVLIKPGSSFEGRPEKPASIPGVDASKPPTRILFVGNLPFETKEEDLRDQFGKAGNIRKIRMMTFEDSGKCKGFAFVDFETEEDATNVIKMRNLHYLEGRKLKLEFGEDRSKRTRVIPNRGERAREEAERAAGGSGGGRMVHQSDPVAEVPMTEEEQHRQKSREGREKKAGAGAGGGYKGWKERDARTIAPGAALAAAPRAKVGIVESKGTKVTFD